MEVEFGRREVRCGDGGRNLWGEMLEFKGHDAFKGMNKSPLQEQHTCVKTRRMHDSSMMSVSQGTR